MVWESREDAQGKEEEFDLVNTRYEVFYRSYDAPSSLLSHSSSLIPTSLLPPSRRLPHSLSSPPPFHSLQMCIDTCELLSTRRASAARQTPGRRRQGGRAGRANLGGSEASADAVGSPVRESEREEGERRWGWGQRGGG
eukprot:314072-Hanusia_phi.AAC.1